MTGNRLGVVPKIKRSNAQRNAVIPCIFLGSISLQTSCLVIFKTC